MKAEKVIGIAACAFACVTSSAFANTTNGWFGVTADTAIRASNCDANGAAVTVEGNRIVLDNDKDTALVITNFTAVNTSDDIVKISATALLTPNSTNDLADAVTVGAKAGFAVGVDDQNATNFYGYANGAWHNLSRTPGDGDTTFSMILNYRDKQVSFYVDGALLGTETLAEAATGLNAIDAYGTGSISSITGAYEVAAAAYGGKKYGSVAEAITAAGTGHKADVKPVDAGGNVPASATAANGLPAVVCSVLGIATDVASAQVKATPVDNDTDRDNITLAIPVSEPGVVKFTVSGGGTSTDYTDASAIKIPLTTGVYTITPALQ